MRQIDQPLKRTSIADIAVHHIFATVKYEIEDAGLSGLKEIGCKSVWAVHISLLFRPIE